MQRKFEPVADNYEKQHTYSIMISKYNLALNNEFYYEAILIDYAMMEDRLRSIIYYLGLLSNSKAVKISNNKAKKTIKTWMEKYYPDKKASFELNSISGKRKIIMSTLKWANENTSCDENNKFESALFMIYSRKVFDINTAIEFLERSEKWCGYRNEITHSLFNKNMPKMNDKIKEIAEEGMAIARGLDSISRWVKYKNVIRKSLKLKEE